MPDFPFDSEPVTTTPTTDGAISITISCDTCVMRATSACDDCIIPMLCGEPEAVIFDYEELRTLAALANAGLTPRLRHRRTA